VVENRSDAPAQLAVALAYRRFLLRAPRGWREISAMRKAYVQARLVGYSRRESLRVALLVGRLSLRDPPTDTWGRRI
jgi:hypothetical protein